MKDQLKKLKKLNPCADAWKWVKDQESRKRAWVDCERGDWMLWLIGKTAGVPMSDERRPLVLAVCDCAELVLEYVPKGEDRPRKAIEAARKWADGNNSVSEQDVRNAATVTYTAAAAYTAYAATADDADDAATAAATAATAAAYAATVTYTDAAAYAAYASTAATVTYAATAATADDADARNRILKQCADIVRKHYPNPPKLK